MTARANDDGRAMRGRFHWERTCAWLRKQFRDCDIIELSAYDTERHEGSAHVGLSALIDLVARKPAKPCE